MLGTAVRCPGSREYRAYPIGTLLVEVGPQNSVLIGIGNCCSERCVEIVAKKPPAGIDPLMKKYLCLDCGLKFWVAPAVRYHETKEEAGDTPPISGARQND
jgi:hypothetical protein